MKICFVYNSIFTLGGIQRCITNLSNYLIKNNYDVTVICCDSNTNIDRKMYNLSNKVKIIFVKEPLIKKLVNLYRKPLVYLNDKFGIFKNNLYILKKIYYPHYHSIKNIIESGNYDIVISSATYFNALISFLDTDDKIKIGWQHSSYSSCFDNGDYKNQDLIVKDIFNKLDNYVVLIDDDKEKIKQNLGYDVTRIYNALEKIPLKTKKLENKKFIAAGRLAKIKRIDLLIRNFNEFSKFNNDWILDIYGEGSEKDNLQKLIDDLNIGNRVNLCGYCSNIEEKYLESSIYCMTSISEGFSMVVAEAMSYGLPVICYDIPAMRELIGKDCGFIVEEGKYDEFVEKMLLLSSDKDLYTKFSENAKEKSKDFDIEKIGSEWIELFDSLIEKRRSKK